MHRSYDVWFASSNANKHSEVCKILGKHGIRAGRAKFTAIEIQADTLEEIASSKVLQAVKYLKRPVIVEDAGLFIDSLGGFPGPYSSYVLSTLGNAGILRLLHSKRSASFHSVIAYSSGSKPKLFSARVPGRIALKPAGGGWRYDPIFVPRGRRRTYGQMEDKNEISHRRMSLEKFASWFAHRRQ